MTPADMEHLELRDGITSLEERLERLKKERARRIRSDERSHQAIAEAWRLSIGRVRQIRKVRTNNE